VVRVEGESLAFLFRIIGALQTDAGFEPVMFDAELPVESRRFKVTAAP
jgi:hypothetical protein